MTADVLEEAASVLDPRQRLLAAPMSAYQALAVAMTVAICVLDGVHVMAITFAAPAIARDWGIGKADLGYVLGAGLLGMAAGSLLIAPLADIFGRRRLVFANLVITVLGSLWTANAHDVAGLLDSRLVTGLGIGAMISVVNPLTAEYANAKRRDLSLSIANIGLPIGAVLGAFVSALLLPRFGWRSIFQFASLFGVLLMPALWMWLPEPISMLIARPRADSLRRVNGYLAKCGLEAAAALPSPPASASAPMMSLFRGGMARVTLCLTGIYFFYMMTMFYMQTWIPTLVVSAGFTPAQGAMISVSENIGGIVGGVCLGAATLRFPLKPMVIGAFAIAAALAGSFGLLPFNLGLFAVMAAVIGFFLIGAGAMGVYAVIGRTFPSHMRASGAGFVIGLGRFGSAIGPALAGQLLAAGLTRGNMSMAMAVPALVSLGLLALFTVRPPTTA